MPKRPRYPHPLVRLAKYAVEDSSQLPYEPMPRSPGVEERFLYADGFDPVGSSCGRRTGCYADRLCVRLKPVKVEEHRLERALITEIAGVEMAEKGNFSYLFSGRSVRRAFAYRPRGAQKIPAVEEAPPAFRGRFFSTGSQCEYTARSWCRNSALFCCLKMFDPTAFFIPWAESADLQLYTSTSSFPPLAR
jgi:hypothetical protein